LSYRVYMKAGWVFLPEWESRSGTAAEEKSHWYDSFRYEILNRCHVNEYRTTRENKDDFIPEWKLSCKHPLISLWFCCRRRFKCLSLDEILLSNRSTKTYWSITVEIMLSFLSCRNDVFKHGSFQNFRKFEKNYGSR